MRCEGEGCGNKGVGCEGVGCEGVRGCYSAMLPTSYQSEYINHSINVSIYQTVSPTWSICVSRSTTVELRWLGM